MVRLARPIEPAALAVTTGLPSEGPNLAVALRLAAAGIAVFPANVTAESGGGWKKVPLVKWRKDATTNEHDIRRWWRMFPNALPGIDCERSRLFVVDGDRHGGPDGLAELDTFQSVHGRFPVGPVTETAGGGLHLYFRQPAAGASLGNAEGALKGKGINVRGLGGWVVAPGATRSDGREWARADGTPDLVDAFAADEIPEVPESIVSAIRPAVPPIMPASTETSSSATVEPRNLPASPNTSGGRSDERERAYIEAAIQEEVDGVASAGPGTRNDTLNCAAFNLATIPVLTDAEIASALRPVALGIGLTSQEVEKTLRSAIRGGRKNLRPWPPYEAAPPPIIVGGRLAAALVPPTSQAPAASSATPSRLWWHGEPSPFDAREWLVRGMIPKGAVGLLSGQSGAGKSFVALDLAVSVIAGEPFAGRKVRARGGVLFVAAEGAFEIPTRLAALANERVRPLGLADVNANALPFAMVDECPSLLRDGRANETAMGALIGAARAARERMEADHHVPLSLVIIDTIAASAGFTDENDAAQAQAMFSALRQLATATEGVVLGVDHFGKAVETGTRGSSAKEAAADFVLAVLADKELNGRTTNRRLAVRKLRGGEQGQEVPFDMRPVVVGHDEEDEPVTTLLVEWSKDHACTATSTKAPRLSGAVLRLLGAITSAGCDGVAKDIRVRGDGPLVRAVNREEVRRVFNEGYAADGDTQAKRDAAKRQAFKRATGQAQSKGLVGVQDDGSVTWLWRVSPTHSTVTERDTP